MVSLKASEVVLYNRVIVNYSFFEADIAVNVGIYPTLMKHLTLGSFFWMFRSDTI